MRIGIIALLSISLASGIFAEDKPSNRPNETLDDKIHQYILDHPEVLMESVQRYQERQKMARAQQTREAIGILGPAVLEDPDTPTVGTSQNPVKVVEFFDYRCAYCKRVDEILLALADENPNVELVFKEFPILGSESVLAAKASLAAKRQNAYVRFHKALMKENGPLTLEVVGRIATELGMNAAMLTKDMQAPEIEAAIARNRKLAEMVHVESTPSFFIDGQLVSGVKDLPEFRALVAKAQSRK